MHQLLPRYRGRFLLVLLLVAAQTRFLEVVGTQGVNPIAGETNGTCSSSSGQAWASYERLAEELRQALQTSTTIAMSVSRDSSQIRDQSHKQQDTAKKKYKLDVSHLNQVLEQNKDHSLRVQAKVTMDQLVQTSLQEFQCLPAVVPEFKSITVAGAIVGGALESSSYRFGQFSDTVLECVVLLANGTLVTVSPTNAYAELFHALPGSYGSLGIVLEATLQTVPLPTEPQVLVSTTIYSSWTEGLAALTELSTTQKGDVDFVDALFFPTHGNKLTIITGKLIPGAAANESIPHINMTSDGLWFYEHLEDQLLATQTPTNTFTMSVYDYLFRYDYGAFWMARPLQFSWSALKKEPKLAGPFVMASRFLRRWVGSWYTTTQLYRALHQLDTTAVAERFVTLDAYLPQEVVVEYLAYLKEHIPTTVPIWLCPVKPPPCNVSQPLSPSGRDPAESRMHSDHVVYESNENNGDRILINVALWGRVSDNRGREYVAAIEHKLVELGGRKMLYSQTTMTAEGLYNQHVDGQAYHRLREQYDPNGVFPALHEKLQLRSSTENGVGDTTSPRSLKYWISRLLL